MKKKNGFTLIELLAVIVILAVIALIAVPQVLKILRQARKSAAVDTTYGIYNAVQDYVSKLLLDNGGDLPSGELVFECDNGGSCVLENYSELVASGYTVEEKIDYKGGKVKGGTIKVTENGKRIDIYDLKINGFTCEHNNDEASCDGLEHDSNQNSGGNSGNNNGGNSGENNGENSGGNSGENNGGNTGGNSGENTCNVAEAGNPKYFAYGDPTTSSTTNYQSLGRTVFISLYDDNCTKGVCIIKNNTLECFKENNFEYEIEHVKQVFSRVCSLGSNSYCNYSATSISVADDFQGGTRSDGSVGFGSRDSTLSECRIIDGVATCG